MAKAAAGARRCQLASKFSETLLAHFPIGTHALSTPENMLQKNTKRIIEIAAKADGVDIGTIRARRYVTGRRTNGTGNCQTALGKPSGSCPPAWCLTFYNTQNGIPR
jgi:hypothetical protein